LRRREGVRVIRLRLTSPRCVRGNAKHKDDGQKQVAHKRSPLACRERGPK
jgi:hypothetical protein